MIVKVADDYKSHQGVIRWCSVTVAKHGLRENDTNVSFTVTVKHLFLDYNMSKRQEIKLGNMRVPSQAFSEIQLCNCSWKKANTAATKCSNIYHFQNFPVLI